LAAVAALDDVVWISRNYDTSFSCHRELRCFS